MHDFLLLHVGLLTPSEKLDCANLSNEYVLVEYKHRYFRAVILGCDKANKEVIVRLIDYGNKVFIHFDK
jgi:hypothetical protein